MSASPLPATKEFFLKKISPSIISLTVSSAIGYNKLDFVLIFYIMFNRMLYEG